jgi:CheY-like chemotaxis protein
VKCGKEHRTVLVADDDPVSQRLVVSALEKWGYEVVTVNNGTDAWRWLEG